MIRPAEVAGEMTAWKRLENLGEVNSTAIEAFQEMKTLWVLFLNEQKNDLVTAEDSLMQTIQEVEATANQQIDTSNRVRDNSRKCV